MTMLLGIHPLLTADLLHAMEGVVNRYDPR